ASLLPVVEAGGPTAPSDPERVATILTRPLDPVSLQEALRRAGAHAKLLGELHELRRRVEDQGKELRELNRIGIALSSERNRDALLAMILTKCREITSADAGSLYLVERKEGAAPSETDFFADKCLLFSLAQNDSVNVPFRASRMEISRQSLAGYAALTGEPLHIEDAYAIRGDAEYRFNRAFDTASGYRTKSLLIIPMRNHKDETIGVLQLINRKRDARATLTGPAAVDDQVIPFGRRTTELASSLSSQAAVAIENARLYEEIQILFEGFIRASVTAIESRDPTTSGHSERVAVLTVGLAERVDRVEAGPYAGRRFSRTDLKEIKYASLLHDFGKIGVKENVLLKEKKLYAHELQAIRDRFAIVRRSLELDASRRKLRHFLELGREEAMAAAASVDPDLAARLAELDRFLETVVQSNEPTVLKEEGSALLKVIAATLVEDAEGKPVPLLSPWEAANLGIGRGSLSPEERREIESHVTHTFQFLSNIPWTRELRQVPRIAYAHHEKLNRSGYPRGIGSGDIPLESKMMTIADIYDALTAKDRPYKRSMPVQKALDILTSEVKEGKVDPDLFRLFTEARVYDLVGTPAAGR
ncbi:MAG: GAF domain-containing protein, partial [Acidobacteria bacterium]|nr:GAF domain-containing protein [Acidobacteriota bacterium]